MSAKEFPESPMTSMEIRPVLMTRPRHCLPKRVTRLLVALNANQDQTVESMIQGAEDCNFKTACELEAACLRIHQAFRQVSIV